MKDEEILANAWPDDPKKNTTVKFVFLSVDVIGHSKLFRDGMPDPRLLQQHHLLKDLRDRVWALIDSERAATLEWDWAGDGGIFAFPANDPELLTTDKVFLKSVAIAEDLARFNAEHQANLELRIVLTRGEGYYYETKELRRGAALNLAAKLRPPGDRTSISVTSEVLNNLTCRLRSEFRRIEMAGHEADIYGYVPLLRAALQREIAATESSDPMQAAHFAYRLGVLNISSARRSAAFEAFERAAAMIDCVDNCHRYYYRTMGEFYRLWARLAKDIPEDLLLEEGANDLRKWLRGGAVQRFFAGHELGAAAFQRLVQMEYCIEQFDLLARGPVNDSIGLTGMHICVLLQRVGYPLRWYGAAIAERIQRIKDEILECGGTVDRECSICTAVASSCMSLSGDPIAKELVAWLASLKGNYSVRAGRNPSRTPAREHALHYAASVLTALLDDDLAKNAAVIDDVLSVFFSVPAATGIPPEWTRYRNIDLADFCVYVFTAFARAMITRGAFTLDRRLVLERALGELFQRLLEEAGKASMPDHPDRIYAARDNIGSFSLGFFLNLPEGLQLIVDKTLKRIEAFALEDELRPSERSRTIDSNLDRTRKMFDGWLLYRECELATRGGKHA